VVREHQTSQPDRAIESSYKGTFAGSWDPERVAQVASNLIGNALKHGDPALPVEVRLDGTHADSVALLVRNGGLIPPEVLPYLFDPFRGRREAGRSEGLGLGLYIVSQIVQAHEGTVEVMTEPPDRTAFRVCLPRTTR
jgi:signal transduction histidine kinase